MQCLKRIQVFEDDEQKQQAWENSIFIEFREKTSLLECWFLARGSQISERTRIAFAGLSHFAYFAMLVSISARCQVKGKIVGILVQNLGCFRTLIVVLSIVWIFLNFWLGNHNGYFVDSWVRWMWSVVERGGRGGGVVK